MKVAYQGEAGAFSEEASRVLYPGASLVPMVSFSSVFESVTDGRVDYGVIPIENSLFGSVHANYDLLRSHELSIVREVQLRVRHNLLVLPGVSHEAIRRVYSHPQALGQCEAYLEEHLSHAEVVPAYDTAGSAKMIVERQERDAAAIASARAAQVYGLEVAAAGIESNHQNFTRFLSLSRHAVLPERDVPSKTSLVYSMRQNVPGALFKSLAVFALREIDLYKIESRPLVGSPGNYLFYLDVQGSIADEPIGNALDHLREITSYLKVLGSYPVGAVIDEPC